MPALKQQDQSEKMTVKEFLLWSEEQDGRWELHDGVPVQLHDPAKMHSERTNHARAKNKVLRKLEQAIETNTLNCEALPDAMTVIIDDTISYQPDALVYCGDPLDGNALVVPNPIIIVEVLSPSTAYKDVSTKLINYFKLPSVMHYLILDPASRQMQHHFRKGGQKDGAVRMKAIFEDTLQLTPPNMTLDLASFWDGV